AELPAGAAVPQPDPVTHGAPAWLVAEAFLTALAQRDGIRALAQTDPVMFVGLDLEPAPEDVDRVVDAARARPVSWEKVRKTYTLNAGHTYLRFPTTATFAGQPDPAPVSLHLNDVCGCWLVAGYLVREKVVLGEDVPD